MTAPLPSSLRIVLADDHAIVRAGLKTLINAQPDMEVIAEVGDGQAAVQRAQELSPDIVVMDVSMPILAGTGATAQIKQCCPDVKVLALSMHEDQSYLRELLDVGAVGYVLKRSAAADLIRALRAVAAGGTYLDPAIASKLLGGLVRSRTQPPSLKGELAGADLSERETEVLRLIAQGYSNKEIANQLSISIKTVETYKARSMEKLGLDSRAQIVRHAVQHGWLNDL